MDSNNSNNLDKLFWEVIEEELMDNTDEELLLSMLEKERQSGSSSRRKRRSVIDRNREEGNIRLFNDYFSENPVYTDAQFRRRFRMHRHLFLRIVETLGNHDEYFQMRVDATGKMGLSPLQKCISSIRMLAYGSSTDIVDEYVRIGSNNDINVLNQFNVFNDILEGRVATVQYTINGTPYNMRYYLSDDIYPEWATIVKTISMLQGEKRKLFAQHQESARKDVEWAFGVLQSRFAIICGPARA
ncbi:uncharacterized protein LOC131643522 [Vicia villosa]|uniref:uncharacterized protein LOC131643522 n=1 Tax=Vicia villosa TaxID=3911 RepID=UPI00273C2292|nr:uncharacterized protein LOC131643522 [Vicia villosa]